MLSSGAPTIHGEAQSDFRILSKCLSINFAQSKLSAFFESPLDVLVVVLEWSYIVVFVAFERSLTMPPSMETGLPILQAASRVFQ
jgi:hypothetical protein